MASATDYYKPVHSSCAIDLGVNCKAVRLSASWCIQTRIRIALFNSVMTRCLYVSWAVIYANWIRHCYGIRSELRVMMWVCSCSNNMITTLMVARFRLPATWPQACKCNFCRLLVTGLVIALLPPTIAVVQMQQN